MNDTETSDRVRAAEGISAPKHSYQALLEREQVFLNLIVNADHAICDVVGESGNRGQSARPA